MITHRLVKLTVCNLITRHSCIRSFNYFSKHLLVWIKNLVHKYFDINLLSYFRACAWGQHRADTDEEKHDEEKPDDETVEKEPEPIKDKGEDFDFIVSGAIGVGSESPEVKVWRVGTDRIKHIHSLTGHSLGIVSVDVSPNGKCKFSSFKCGAR